MSKTMKEISEEPTYATEASSFSKASIGIFIGTCIYEFFFTSANSGMIWGVVFLLVGIFVVSIIIAAPLFYIRKRYSLGLLTDILLVGLVIYLTHTIFQSLF